MARASAAEIIDKVATAIKGLCEEHGTPNRFSAAEISRASALPRRTVLLVIRGNILALQDRTSVARQFPTLVEPEGGAGGQRMLYVANRSTEAAHG